MALPSTTLRLRRALAKPDSEARQRSPLGPQRDRHKASCSYMSQRLVALAQAQPGWPGGWGSGLGSEIGVGSSIGSGQSGAYGLAQFPRGN
jgi:hypothetical protein